MRLVNDNNKSIACSEVAPSTLAVLSEDRLEILRMLSEKPRYPAELARELSMPVQTIYYHIRLLEKARLLEFVDYEERNGGIAKKYACSAESCAVVLNNRAWREHLTPKKIVPNIFASFIKHSLFDGLFVVGSPDSHGKYRARASELGVLELAMLLGQYASFSFPLYSLDTQIRSEDKKRNLILAGGPKVNTLVAELNNVLPIRFSATFELFSTLSKKRYIGNVGVIELISNPFFKSHDFQSRSTRSIAQVSQTLASSRSPKEPSSSGKSKILLVGGLNYMGTRAAMLALVRNMRDIENGNSFKPQTLAKVVEGFDENGDGLIDSVDILE